MKLAVPKELRAHEKRVAATPNSVKKLIAFAFVVLFFCGCATPSARQVAELSYNLAFENDPRMRFQGKGAGAGMMLSSSMGPMGIAIGVAIDEGIGKDIQSAVDSHGFNMQLAVQNALQQASSGYLLMASESEAAPLKIVIGRYGYKTHPGEGDLVTPDINGTVQYLGDKAALAYPIEGLDTLTLSFDQVKTDGKAASEVFEKALHVALEKALSEIPAY